MATRPDGISSKPDRVTFTRHAADRIAAVVREVEQGNNGSSGLSFSPRLDVGRSGSGTFRVCTFTGSWSIATDKTVTFKYQTSTPNTVVATNLFWPVPDGGQRDCAIARDGTAWFLVTPQMSNTAVMTTASLTTTGIQFSTYKVLSMAGDDTATFTITPPTVDAVTGASLSETGLEFTRSQIGVIFVNTAVTLSVSVTTCSTAAV